MRSGLRVCKKKNLDFSFELVFCIKIARVAWNVCGRVQQRAEEGPHEVGSSKFAFKDFAPHLDSRVEGNECFEERTTTTFQINNFTQKSENPHAKPIAKHRK